MQTVLAVILAPVVDTARLLLFFLGPVFVAAFGMYLVSSVIGRTAGRSLGLRAFAWMTAPGTVVHETGHAVFCLIFGHKIKEIRFFDPQPDGTLGKVVHSWRKGNIYQSFGNFFIGTGPIWFGCGVVYLLSIILMGPDFLYLAVSTPVSSSDLSNPYAVGALVGTFARNVAASAGNMLEPALLSSWKFWVFFYLTLCIGLHMNMSPADMKGAWPGLLLLVGLVFVLNLVVSIFVVIQPASAAAGAAASVTARLAGVALSVTGVLAFTILPALIVMLLIDLFALIVRLFR